MPGARRASLDERLKALQRHWQAFGSTDPLRAILCDPDRAEPWRLDEFFADGEREIDAALEQGSRLGLPRERRAALDFGCGIGRLTQALGARFVRAVGVDVAPSMIEAARRQNAHGEPCEYVLNEEPSLARFSDRSFDLVYSNLTLQHMEHALSEAYVAELARVLAEGGLLVFQLPSGTVEAAPLPPDAFRAHLELLDPPTELQAGAAAEVRVLVRNDGGRPWPSPQVKVGNHWRARRTRRLLVRDDGRRVLPVDMPPGAEIELELTVAAPAKPGTYLLEVDLVQEEVAWFAKRGSPTARTAVRVVTSPTAYPAPEGEPEPMTAPRMEMHGVPRERVLELLAAAGLRLLEVEENDAAGPGWVSLRYWATRDS